MSGLWGGFVVLGSLLVGPGGVGRAVRSVEFCVGSRRLCLVGGGCTVGWMVGDVVLVLG